MKHRVPSQIVLRYDKLALEPTIDRLREQRDFWISYEKDKDARPSGFAHIVWKGGRGPLWCNLGANGGATFRFVFLEDFQRFRSILQTAAIYRVGGTAKWGFKMTHHSPGYHMHRHIGLMDRALHSSPDPKAHDIMVGYEEPCDNGTSCELGIAFALEKDYPHLIRELTDGVSDSEVKRMALLANQCGTYQEYTIHLALHRMKPGLDELDCVTALRAFLSGKVQWQDDPAERHRFAVGKLAELANMVLVFGVTILGYDRNRDEVEELLARKPASILLASPRLHSWLDTFQEEYESSVQPERFRQTGSRLVDWWRHILLIMKQAQWVKECTDERTELRFAPGIRPTLRFTITDQAGVLTPSPFRIAGDLIAPTGFVRDKRVLRSLRSWFANLWESSEVVGLRGEQWENEILREDLPAFASMLQSQQGDEIDLETLGSVADKYESPQLFESLTDQLSRLDVRTVRG